MIFLGTQKLCGGLYILFFFKVSFEKHPKELVFRKLVNESLGIFLSLHKLAEVGVVSDQMMRRTILINMKSQMHSCDNWSTGESVSTLQERD